MTGIVRAIDAATKDWQFGKGRNDYKIELNAVAQNVETRLTQFLGDCFFAQEEGIDWFNLLGNKDRTELNLAIGATILNTKDVTGIIDFTFVVDDNRNATINYEIITVYENMVEMPFPVCSMEIGHV